MALTSWHLRSRAHRCALTDNPFTEGDRIVTAIFPDPESSGYLRRDYHQSAWESRDDAEAPFSFWRSEYQPPAHEPEVDPMKEEDPESLLQRLIEEDDEHTENVRYILAVMLERQKLLRETDAQPVPDGILRVYEHRKTGEAFIVRDPNIPLEQVEKVQEEVFLLLENGGRPAEPEAESGSDDPPEGNSEPGEIPETDEETQPATETDDGESAAEVDEPEVSEDRTA